MHDDKKLAPQKVLGRLRSGEMVVDRPTSHLHRGVEIFLAEALPKVDAQGREFFQVEIDLGRIIGEQTCVETTSDDEVLYAQRPKRSGLTRFVKGREPIPTSSLAAVLMKQKDATIPTYMIITAFFGKASEVEPWNPKATEASLIYWNTHALIWGTESIVEGTETRECPWLKEG